LEIEYKVRERVGYQDETVRLLNYHLPSIVTWRGVALHCSSSLDRTISVLVPKYDKEKRNNISIYFAVKPTNYQKETIGRMAIIVVPLGPGKLRPLGLHPYASALPKPRWLGCPSAVFFSATTASSTSAADALPQSIDTRSLRREGRHSGPMFSQSPLPSSEALTKIPTVSIS
jgi:hypothetical protein